MRRHASDLRRHSQSNYGRLSTDRDTAQKYNLEWVTPGHPLFEALRRHSVEMGQQHLAKRCLFPLAATSEQPARLDFYRARVVDGLGKTVHERLFAVEIGEDGDPTAGGAGPTGQPDTNCSHAAYPAHGGRYCPKPTAVAARASTCARFLEETRTERSG